jgi:hypothetical protein
VNARVIYAGVATFVTMLALAVANVAYTNHVNRLSDERNRERARDFCGVVVIIDNRYQQLPPSSDPRALQFAAAIHAYRAKLGC